jgi:predicted amidohydrolase
MTVRPGTVTMIRGGRLLNARAHRADPGDILVTGDTISEIGPPGLAAPAGAVTIDPRGMLLHPGLVVGNSSYLIGPLKNRVNDAADMARLLPTLGFRVTLLKQL